MPKARIIQTYQFDELSDEAKERARTWYRDGMGDDNWWEYTYEDAGTWLPFLGFTIKQRPYKTMGGKTRYEAAIMFSGFSSQGDGACFEGAWGAADVQPVSAMQDHAPYLQADERTHSNKGLHDMAVEANEIKAALATAIEADADTSCAIRHTGHYSHSSSVEYEHGDYPAEIAERIEELARDAMNYIYRALETEWEWRNSDEQVDENILANEYEFTAEGRRCAVL